MDYIDYYSGGFVHTHIRIYRTGLIESGNKKRRLGSELVNKIFRDASMSNPTDQKIAGGCVVGEGHMIDGFVYKNKTFIGTPLLKSVIHNFRC